MNPPRRLLTTIAALLVATAGLILSASSASGAVLSKEAALCQKHVGTNGQKFKKSKLGSSPDRVDEPLRSRR